MANDSTAIAIYKLAMESQQYVAAAQAAMQANQGLAASAAPVVAGEEKIDRALRGGEAALDRKIARFDAASRINAKYAKEFADLQKIEEAGIGSAEKRAQALALVTAAHQKELEALDRIKKANAENAAALGSETAALKASAAAGDRHAAALLEMQRKQADLNSELQAGNVTLVRHAQLTNVIRESYRNSTTAIAAQEAQMRKSATATGLARHELINLSRQFQDIGVSLAGGQSPFRILIEQGSQIADVFLSSKAKLVEVFGAIGAAIRNIGTGAIVGTIGGVVAALTAAAGAAALSWQSARKDIEISMIGIGAASGVAIDKIEKIAVSSAKMWGGLSVSEAREFAGALAATGVVGEESIEKLTKAGKDFAVVMGKDSTEAVKMLVKTLETAEPGQLPRQMQILDAATLRSIQSLREQGKVMEANKIIADALVARFGGVADQAGVVSKAWSAAGNFISDRWTKLGAVINKIMGTDVAAGSEEAIARIKKQLEDLQNLRVRGGGVGFTFAAQEAALNKELERQIALREKNKTEAKETRDIIQSMADQRIIRDLVPDIAMMEKLKNEAEATARALEKAQAAQGGPTGARTGATIEQTALAAARSAEAQRSALTQAQKLTAEYELQVRSIEARTAEERVALAQQQATVALAGQRVSAEEKATAVARAGNLVIKERAAAHQDAMISLGGQLKVAEAFTGQEKLAATEEARKTELMRQGFDAYQAETQAAGERAVAQARINDGIKQQIRLMDMANEQSRADIEGRGDAVRVEQAYANAIHAGADARTAQAAADAQARQNAANRLNQEILATREYRVQLQAVTARTQAERISVAAAQAYYQALAQGKELWQAQAAGARAAALEEAKLAQAHRDAMIALQGQLKVAQARTGAEQISAQYYATITQLMQQGLSLSQATAQAELQRQITIANINKGIMEQVHSLEQATALLRAQREGASSADLASMKAAQAYENAIRQGASETAAAALEAATLANELERAAGSANRMAGSINSMGLGMGPVLGGITSSMEFPGADIRRRQSETSGGISGFVPGTIGGVFYKGELLTLAAAIAKQSADIYAESQTAQEAAANAAQQAAQEQQRAAAAAIDAAKAQEDAAKAAREARISALDEAIKDIVATKLLAGQSAAAVNLLIEQGAIQFGTASTRFQTQLDLYKRAGASNSQIAADIRSGIIGEGARPSELLEALDSLKDAVEANTDAQLGLSPFYTSQGDRQLGYRGYTVQKGASNIPGTQVGGSTTGTPGTGTGGMIGGGVPITGGVINYGGGVSYEQGLTGGANIEYRYINGVAVGGRTNPITGIWTPLTGAEADAANAALRAAGYNVTPTYSGSGLPSYQAQSLARGSTTFTGFAEGGMVDRPTLGMFGEAGPEAFVPLKGGAIPVKLVGQAANQNQPTNVVNINAPLVHFAAEPTRDEVRESAFQAAQMLRRVAMG